MENQNIFYRDVKTFVVRKGRMTSGQRKQYALLSSVWCIPYKEEVLDFEKVFQNKNPVVVEIGFGMGTATAIIAENNPEINYLGLEVHTPGVGKLLGEIEKRGLKNIRIVEHDAIEVLNNMIGDSSLAGFHVFFPDPWQKKRHYKRRLVSIPRTYLFLKKLKPASYFYMVTDWDDYAESALISLSETSGFENQYDGFAPSQSWRPLTKFEERAKKEGRKVSELFFVKKN
ncbi:MAG: tRNA (guanosine(46)-N7)-methyltransferase TrmB [Treponema sp.]|nr:tRNA (guanosine(46)-N7)-methyltransferase TrmB [Treponema sp.]